MLIKIGVPLVAAAALGFGAATTMILKPEDQVTSPPSVPASTTLGTDVVAGLGELQAADEAVALGVAAGGIVGEVHVRAGDLVKRGDALLTIRDGPLQAELGLRRSALAAACARLEKLRAGTRPEELPSARARVDAARVEVLRAGDFLQRARAAGGQGAVSTEELNTREFDLRRATAEFEQASGELSRLEAGTWARDIEIARCEVEQAEAEVRLAQSRVDQLVTRAPCDAMVLRVDARAGEFVQPGDVTRPPIVLGPSGTLQVRVQVDEEEASLVLPDAPAEAFVRGRARQRLDLRFVRIEPRVVAKTSLTGATTERVDTRVLFVVYEVVGTPERVYAGQKLDVFIRAGTPR